MKLFCVSIRTASQAALLASVGFGSIAIAAPGDTTRVSVDSSGVQGNNISSASCISADGRFVAFGSAATNLVDGDTNSVSDIFVHDRQTGMTNRVSVDSSGLQGNGHSENVCISTNGRYVAFASGATNLVDGDTNRVDDIFVHDRQTGMTSRVSVDSSGVQGDEHSFLPSISADGRFVAFRSDATNLVDGDTNSVSDIFVHDRQTGMTTRVSVDSNGIQGNGRSDNPSISTDGRFVAFRSAGTNLVDDDTNSVTDIFVHDRQTGVTTRVSMDSRGIQGDNFSFFPSISADGRFIAFGSAATNLVDGDTNSVSDIFVHDRQTGMTTRVSVDSNGVQGNASNGTPSISAGGRFVVFSSAATNLVDGDTNDADDVFVHDRQTGMTTRVSLDSSGGQGNGFSLGTSISAEGRFVSFFSEASNLVAGDTNNTLDVFVHEMPIAQNTAQGNGAESLVGSTVEPPVVITRTRSELDIQTADLPTNRLSLGRVAQGSYALMDVLETELKSMPLTGLVAADACYFAGLGAAAGATASDFVLLGVNEIAVGITQVALNNVTTGTQFGDTLLRMGVDLASAVAMQENASLALGKRIAQETLGYVLPELTRRHFEDNSGHLANVLTPLSTAFIEELLVDEGISTRRLTSTNEASQAFRAGLLPRSQMELTWIFSPKTHYLTAYISSKCDNSIEGFYVVRFKMIPGLGGLNRRADKDTVIIKRFRN